MSVIYFIIFACDSFHVKSKYLHDARDIETFRKVYTALNPPADDNIHCAHAAHIFLLYMKVIHSIKYRRFLAQRIYKKTDLSWLLACLEVCYDWEEMLTELVLRKQ